MISKSIMGLDHGCILPQDGEPWIQPNYAMESTVFIALITTFFFVSVTPGMCMTLALTLGMTVGLRRTMWMMAGELVGVGLVVVLSMLGVAALVLPVSYTHLRAHET